MPTNQPLRGYSVLVTRPRRQAEGLRQQLEQLGATVYSWPVVDIGPPPDLTAVDRAIQRLSEFQWLVFSSVNGVEALLARMEEIGHDAGSLAQLRLAAIGPKTAAALQARQLHTEVIPAEYRSEGLAETLLPLVAGQRVLLARADRGRELLQKELATVAEVEQVAVYSQTDTVEANSEVLQLLRSGKIDFVTLTSANVVRAFVRLLDAASRQRLGNEVRLVTISPVTSAAARELGIPVAGEATAATMDGLVSAVVRCAASSSRAAHGAAKRG